MKIGIVTFQETNNYGAILQNFALQKAIEKHGHVAETVDYRSKYIAKPYRLSHLKNKGLGKYAFGVVGYLCYMPRTHANKKFRKNINYSKKVKKEQLAELNNDYDCFITGSDQVWNVNLTGYDDTYFLKFVTDSFKKNSYAASVGISELDDKQKEWYADKLSDYHMITVREKASIGLLKQVTEKEVVDVLDPVFLLTQDEWKKYVKPVKEKGDYILVYQLGLSTALVNYAKECAKKYGCKLVFFPFPLVGAACGKYKVCGGSGELLSYIAGAKYVITDSFHGTSLSIIFNKKFTTLVSGTHSAVSSRLTSMLDMLGLSNRIWNSELNLDEEIDYPTVNQLIEVGRNNSDAMLEKILVREES